MGLTRKFTLYKRGELVEVSFSGSNRFTEQKAHQPLPLDRIVGVDTESLKRKGNLETVLVPMHFSTGQQVIRVLPDGPASLDLMLRAVCERYSIPDSAPSRHEQRDRGPDGKRHGRRDTINPVLLVFFNLPYDIGRLCADHRQLLRALASGADTYRVRVGHREVEVARMVLAAGSSFEWYVRETDTGGNPRITRILGIDCHGYWKSSLKEACKAVGVTEKLEYPIDFERDADELSEQEWADFARYAGGDAQSTSELYSATVDLLRTVDIRVVRRTGIVPPSAPGAAARIAFAKAHDLHPEKASWRRYPAWADQLGCDAYRGGRAFCARPGKHSSVSVWDIKSAYPYAMTQLPDPVTLRCERVPDTEWNESNVANSLERWRGKFGVLVIDGEGKDPVYPALRCHDERRGRLRGVYGRFTGLAATIPEVLIGVADGSLRVDRISNGVVMEGSSEKSFLRAAMLDFFAIKDNPENESALRGMGKLLANATYGKLIEVQYNQHWIDSDVMCPDFVNLDQIALVLAKLYAETPEEEYDDRASALIERWTNHRIECEELLCIGCGGEETRAGAAIPLRVRMQSHKRYRCGQFFMPLYAAQITGLTSGSLGLMARCTGAAQGDTDSVHVIGDRPYGIAHFYDIMNEAGYEWPRKGLGRWTLETPEPSEESLCARVKLYSHRLPDTDEIRQIREQLSQCTDEDERLKLRLKFDSLKYKQAKHGFSKYPGGAEELHEAIRDVVNGTSHKYVTKPSPRKIREAIMRDLPVGEFVSREITVEAGIDPNTRIRGGVCNWKPIGPESKYYSG
jgi:hypothetical protein